MLPHKLVSEVLDYRIGEKLFAYPLYLLARPDRVGFGQIDLDVFALPHVVDAAKAQVRQRVLDRLALRVEDTGLKRDPDTRLHGFPGKEPKIGSAPPSSDPYSSRQLRLGPFNVAWSSPAPGRCPWGAGSRSARQAAAPLPGRPPARRPCRDGSGPYRACRTWRHPKAGSSRGWSRRPARCSSARSPTAARTPP